MQLTFVYETMGYNHIMSNEIVKTESQTNLKNTTIKCITNNPK